MRLIDADALEKRLDNEKWMDNYDRDFIVDVALDEAPTVDAAPVVHGRWEEADWVEPDGYGFGCVRKHKAALRCTNCRCCFKKELLWENNFCPSCGARMD